MQVLAMGGYGGYVWPAFGFALVLMIGLLWQSWHSQKQRSEELARLRRTVRGDGERPARRLVASKPGATPSGHRTHAGVEPQDGRVAHAGDNPGMGT